MLDTHEYLFHSYGADYVYQAKKIAEDWNNYIFAKRRYTADKVRIIREEVFQWLQSEGVPVNEPIISLGINGFKVKVVDTNVNDDLSHLTHKQLKALIEDYLFSSENVKEILDKYDIYRYKYAIADILPRIQSPRACSMCHSKHTAMNVPSRAIGIISEKFGLDSLPITCLDCAHDERGDCYCAGCLKRNKQSIFYEELEQWIHQRLYTQYNQRIRLGCHIPLTQSFVKEITKENNEALLAGTQLNRYIIAINMLLDKLPLDKISHYTQLHEDTLHTLKEYIIRKETYTSHYFRTNYLQPSREGGVSL